MYISAVTLRGEIASPFWLSMNAFAFGRSTWEIRLSKHPNSLMFV